MLIKRREFCELVMDMDYFEKLIDNNPYSTLSFFKRCATIDNKHYKESTLSKMVMSSRKRRFPRKESEVLCIEYCRTLDNVSDKKQSFYQGRGEIIDKKGRLQKCVLFATKFSLRCLAKSNQ